MLGRGTRLCPDINKEKFTVFDCFDGTLIEYFKQVSNFDFSEIGSDPIPVEEVIRRINDNQERDYNVNVFVKRIRRIEKTISSEGRKQFEAFIPDGDFGKFADGFKDAVKNNFTTTMKLLNNKDFQKLLLNYKRAKSVFYVAHNVHDDISSQMVFEAGDKYLKPIEYLEAFAQFVKENKHKIEAMKIVLERPKEWKTEVLRELRVELLKNHFPEASLKRAAQLVHKKHLPDIISLIKSAASNEVLLEVTERIEKAILSLFGSKTLTTEQTAWVQYIKEHLIQNLTLDKEDFDYSPILERHGGWGRFRKVFNEEAETIIQQINAAIAA
jgi:type I restriction enzyme R subunit